MKLEFGLMSGGGLCGWLIIHYCYSYYLLGFFYYSSGGFPPSSPLPPPKEATRYLPHSFSPLPFFKHLKFDGQKMHVMNCMLLVLLLFVRRRLPAGLCCSCCCCYVAPFQLMPSYVTVIAPAKLLSLSLSFFLLWRQEEFQ